MTDEVPIPIGPLSSEEKSAVGKLTEADLRAIDAAIIAETPARFRKVAWVGVKTEKALSEQYPKLSFAFYVHRIIHLVDEGRLEAAGNPEYPRFSEIRLPEQ